MGTDSGQARPADETDRERPSGVKPTPARRHPEDFSVSVRAKGSTDRLLVPDQQSARSPLPGFDPAYVDIVDYIVRITHRIWEGRDIGYIYDTYRHTCRVTDDTGAHYGRDKVVADTVHTINAFPDVRLFADEIIWASDSADRFYTSHRTVITGHNTGYSRWGAPTGRGVVVWCIANCTADRNEIFEEWVLYNNAHLFLQMGFDIRALARAAANEAPVLDDLIGARGGEVERLLGQAPPNALAPPADSFADPEEILRRTLHNAWNRRDLSAIDRAYAHGARIHGATGRELYGRGEVKAHILSFLAMFPDLAFQVDDVYWMGNERDGYSVALRWTALGTHRGNGIYGPPTDRRTLLWGLSQYHLVDRLIQEEWTIFNEFEVLQQLERDVPMALAS